MDIAYSFNFTLKSLCYSYSLNVFLKKKKIENRMQFSYWMIILRTIRVQWYWFLLKQNKKLNEHSQEVVWKSRYSEKKMHIENTINMLVHRNQFWKTLSLHRLPSFYQKQKIRACSEKVLCNGFAHAIILRFAARQLTF